MSAKNMKLLRKGAEKLKLPYKMLKKSFKKLTLKEKEKFLADARRIDYLG